MSQRTALLTIDAQIDFCDVAGAALPVKGAVKDLERVAKLIKDLNPDHIYASMDTHYALDISHPAWFKKPDGSFVDPFTMITSDDIKNGKYIPRVDPKATLEYVEALETQGEFPHFIWSEHCLWGSTGQALHPIFFDAVSEWMKKNLKWVSFIQKGIHPYTENFGIFRANIPNSDPSTQVNQSIFNAMNNFDRILLTGEAQSHCVANSLKQLTELAPQLAPKVLVIEDCMSPVPGLSPDFYTMVEKLYDNAKAKGVQFVKSTDL